mgnify:CR=1
MSKLLTLLGTKHLKLWTVGFESLQDNSISSVVSLGSSVKKRPMNISCGQILGFISLSLPTKSTTTLNMSNLLGILSKQIHT